MAEPTKDKHREPAASEPAEDEDLPADDETSKPTENEDTNTNEDDETSKPTMRVRNQHSTAGSRPVVRWLASAALVIALSALGVSLWVLLHPPTPSAPAAPPAPSAQQITDAKTRACAAYVTVRTAVNARSNADPGPDLAATQAEVTSANARQALSVGRSYLLSNLDPATPAPLAAAIQRFAGLSDEVAINALAGATTADPAQAGRLQNFVTLDGQITELCK